MTHHILNFLLLTVGIFAFESSVADVAQRQANTKDAPTGPCNFPDIDANTPIRITIGDDPIPYYFACGKNRPRGVCAANTLPPGLIVNLGVEQNGWACVTGGDSTSGWIPADSLAEVPVDPKVPLAEWLGWWRQGEDVKGEKNNRLLITNQPGSQILHVSGRAYWYGLNNNVHFGNVDADAAPIGIYLHLVGSDSCVVDLKFDLATHILDATDNMRCGALNVRFSGEWSHYIPKLRSK